jgi:hypothetical protein
MSGRHRRPRRPLSASAQEWHDWDVLARELGVRWAPLTRSLLNEAVAARAKPLTRADIRNGADIRSSADIRSKRRRAL